jgi:cell division transport system permease protein
MRFQYVLQEIGQGLRRNLTMVIAVVVSTAVALVMLGSSALMYEQTQAMQDFWYGKVEVSVFLCNADEAKQNDGVCSTAVTAAQEADIKAKLLATPYVQHVDFESQAQAYVHYKQQPGSSAFLQGITANSLQDSFRVKLSDPNKADVVAGAVNNKPGVQSVVDENKLLAPLTLPDHLRAVRARARPHVRRRCRRRRRLG